MVDLAQLDYIGSSGLRVLIAAGKRARAQQANHWAHGDVRIVHLPLRIKAVFDLTGLTSVFHIYDNLAEAVESWSGSDREERRASGEVVAGS